MGFNETDMTIEMPKPTAAYSDPVPNSQWRHVKRGTLYHVDGFCTIESTMQRGVIYTCMASERVWVRPVSEFVDGRFEPVDTQAT